MDDDIRPFAGNHVIIQSGGAAVLLAHLRRGSVVVRAGHALIRGQRLGAVGNSGNSLAPHLHVEALDRPDPLRAQIIPFRLRRYERWARGSWEAVSLGSPAPGERIRVTALRDTRFRPWPRRLPPHEQVELGWGRSAGWRT